MKIKVNLKKIVVVLFLSIAFLYRYNAEKVEWYYQYVVSAPVILLGIVPLFSKKKQETVVARRIMKMACIPYALAFLYTVVLWIMGLAAITTITRGISTSLQYVYLMLVAGTIISMFGKNSAEIVLKSCILSYAYTLIMALNGIGINGIFAYIISPLSSLDSVWFEMHDICLSAGLFLVYFISIQPKNERNYKHIIAIIIIIYFGFKRIGIGAAIIAMFIALFVKRKESKNQKSKLLLITTGILSICYLYTFLINSGIFDLLLSTYNINAMGRSAFYSYFQRFYEWSVFYVGKGVGFVAKQLSVVALEGVAKYGLYGVQALHNDILKVYIELGFVGSLAWFYYYLRIMTNRFKKYFGFVTERSYCILLIYSFITYATDNTMNYFVFQIAFYVIIATIAIGESIQKQKFSD